MTKGGRQRCLWEYLGFVLLFLLAAGGLWAVFFLLEGRHSPLPSAGTGEDRVVAVVIDPGHGGEDGGAVGKAGEGEVREKDLNLAIALALKEQLEARGIPVILTRQEDILLYDKNSDYKGHKKEQDLATRLKIGQEHPEAVFVSIHMNAFPQSQYHGLQVYYSPGDPRSATLATTIQGNTRATLQPDNRRAVKRAGSEIYLLHHLTTPAVLVECGFLSNPEECGRLNDPDYQAKLAGVLCDSIVEVFFSAG